MKAWILILICLILGYVLFDLARNDSFVIVTNKHYKYLDCDLKYKHKSLYTNYIIDYENIFQEDSAKYALMRCLCNKYIIKKDSSIKNYVLEFYNGDYRSKKTYIREMPHNKIDTNILYKYREKIFRNDARIIDAIEKYKPEDSTKLKKILINAFNKSNHRFSNYYEILYDLPIVIPSFDTIVKYREIIFKTPERYHGDA